jgi:hypothetical protein
MRCKTDCMDTGGRLDHIEWPAALQEPRREAVRRRLAALTGGGADGNEQITAIDGALLLVLLAAIGVTILRVKQLIWIHLFIGLLLLGPVGLKMATTGYRFVRYYTDDPEYRRKGPPKVILRSTAPIVVVTTVVVFVSGIVLLFNGPANRAEWLSIHKVSFIVWVVFTALHVLGHLPGVGRALGALPVTDWPPGRPNGAGGRWIALTGAVVGGLVIAIVLIPQFHLWTAPGAFPHHHHGG